MAKTLTTANQRSERLLDKVALPTLLLGIATLAVITDGCASNRTHFDEGQKSRMRKGETQLTRMSIVETRKPGVITTIPVPPSATTLVPARGFHDRTPMPFMASVRMIDGVKARLAAKECAIITECDGQEYELLVISPEQTSQGTGRAAY